MRIKGTIKWDDKIEPFDCELDDARDRARFGGPITDAMLHTALRVAAYDPSTNPQHHFNLATLASHINGWLHPVDK